ncbi:hypothetical protein RB595_004250 [Gaeumannomyces hyphopodioides]
MSRTIANHVGRSLVAIRVLAEPDSKLSFQQPWIQPRIKDEQTRFKVWAGNIGAHKTGTSSLDYRLRDASPIKDQVISLLEELVDLLDQATAIARGEKTPWDQLEDEELDSDSGLPITELGQIVNEGVTDVVDCLLRLSTTIRNPAPHDRFAATHPTDASHFEPWDIQHAQSKFPTIEPWLADRLGKAISKRRQYLRYRESHHAKLSQGLDDPDHVANEGDCTVASSIPEGMKDRPTAKPAVLEDDGSDAGASQTSYATSVADSGALKIPPMPEEAHAGPFQCPFCYMMIMATDRTAWKKHVYSDLRPYICLEKECMVSSSEQEFSRRHEWMRHVEKTHWHAYPCLLGCTSVLSSPAAYSNHLSRAHASSVAQGDIDALLRLAAQPIDISAGIPCPLCGDGEMLRSKKEYRRHVSRHQEQLSLFSLPRNLTDQDGDDDDDEIKSGQNDGGHSNGTADDGSLDSDKITTKPQTPAAPPPPPSPPKPAKPDPELEFVEKQLIEIQNKISNLLKVGDDDDDDEIKSGQDDGGHSDGAAEDGSVDSDKAIKKAKAKAEAEQADEGRPERVEKAAQLKPSQELAAVIRTFEAIKKARAEVEQADEDRPERVEKAAQLKPSQELEAMIRRFEAIVEADREAKASEDGIVDSDRDTQPINPDNVVTRTRHEGLVFLAGLGDAEVDTSSVKSPDGVGEAVAGETKSNPAGEGEEMRWFPLRRRKPQRVIIRPPVAK